MTASIYHFYKDLYERRRTLCGAGFSFDKHPVWRDEIVSTFGSKGTFPDIILKTNRGKGSLTGGEMIEIKEARSYGIPSFNSTLPSSVKDIREVAPETGKIYADMLKNEGVDPYDLPLREVYYLLRGQHGGNTKICLLHGAFFDTLPADENIGQMFGQVLEDAMQDNPSAQNDPSFSDAKEKLMQLHWKQEYFKKTRQVENASIKLRLRLMAEVYGQANILNGNNYPDILDNTLNMIVPLSSGGMSGKKAATLMKKAFAASALPKDIHTFTLRHFLGLEFFVFQAPLES